MSDPTPLPLCTTAEVSSPVGEDEGFTPGYKHSDVLLKAPEWLDNEEEEVLRGGIHKELFLPQSTADGSQVTLKETFKASATKRADRLEELKQKLDGLYAEEPSLALLCSRLSHRLFGH
ncbi:hypothetical protein HPB52_017274 [Rhipicephalus sanguineus]|uniref:Uncharacterized protein n=1 Tax=Rhipicephalus sanguineus TaxID=34632 RepID=A0A9D4QBG2_RHISA|nr:hypothetical protein HPB52_017274 [Rhipicephalus sanguineus]